MAEKLLAVGSEVLLRYRYADGSVQAALPMRVVEHTSEVLAAWLAPGTPIMYWTTADGRDPRDVPLEARFASTLSTGLREWTGTGALHLIRPGEPLQVLLFWDAGGRFSDWYVNLERPAVRTGSRIESVDRQLDLVVSAAGEARWKDFDEAVFAVGTPFLPLEDLVAARRDGTEILHDLPGFMERNGRWRGFRPDPSWPVPKLPDDWRD